MKQHPDMMSICFNAHDECFQPDPQYPPVELYGIHSREELEGYCRETKKNGVKPEVESFHYGAIWNALRFINAGLLDTPVWTTFFLGWPGRLLDPSHRRSHAVHARPQAQRFQLQRERHGPANPLAGADKIYPAWRTRSRRDGGQSISGQGDTLARSNAELVEKIVRIGRELGREIASPDEAREITGLAGKPLENAVSPGN